MKRLAIRIHISDCAIQLSANHVSGVPNRASALFRGDVGTGHLHRLHVGPGYGAVARGISFGVATARPGNLITGLRIAVPDERFPVFRPLIEASGHHVCE